MLNSRLWTWLSVAAVVMLFIPACKQGGESGKPATETSETKGLQAQNAEWANKPDAEEARQWFAKPNARFWNESSLNIPALVEELYGMGATEVIVIGISREQDVELAAALLVELPANTADRAKLFERGKKMAELMGEPPVQDTGQQYLYYAFD